MDSTPLRIRGKNFAEADILTLQSLIAANADKGRRSLSRLICEHFGWVQPNGCWQDVAARDILLKLEGLGYLRLPPRKIPVRNNRQGIKPVDLELPLEEPVVVGRLGEFSGCRLTMVANQNESSRWNALIQRYHYLGYKPMVGRSLKYWIKLGNQDVGLIGWGSPSWKLSGRDKFIGWEGALRERQLQGIANNTRFLIFPWVHVKYLASHVLSLCARTVPPDWFKRYGVKLYLFETFVDPTRYRGTCYKAANWIYVGTSKGSSKSGDSYFCHGQKKDIYVYPLSKDFREHLCR